MDGLTFLKFYFKTYFASYVSQWYYKEITQYANALRDSNMQWILRMLSRCCHGKSVIMPYVQLPSPVCFILRLTSRGTGLLYLLTSSLCSQFPQLNTYAHTHTTQKATAIHINSHTELCYMLKTTAVSSWDSMNFYLEIPKLPSWVYSTI